MPKTTGAASGTLRRNQACRQCRKRKLKCDAQRPHCGTCQKQWAAQISVPPPVGFAHPKEPTCTYDPVEGLVLAPETVDDPNERVRVLEAQIAQLQGKLNAAHMESIGRHEQSPPLDSIGGPPSFTASSTSPPNIANGSGNTGFPGQPMIPKNPMAVAGGAYNDSSAYPSTSRTSTDGYYLQGDAQQQQYPSVSDEYEQQQYQQQGNYSSSNHRASGSYARGSSHPYHRETPHISSSVKNQGGSGSRADGYHGPGGLRVVGPNNVDPFTGDVGIASVSRLGRQSESRSRGYSLTNNPSPPYFDLMYSGWSRDLPPRHEMANYIEIFFRCDPCGSRMLHRPTLLSNLNYPPTHPDFPHSALLHAICAAASRFTLRGRMDPTSSDAALSATNGTPTTPLRDRFAEFHANKTRMYVNQTMSNGQNIFDVFQACIILSWWFYSEGRWVEVWVQAGFQTRAVIPLGLNYLGLVKRGPDGAVVRNPYLAPPRSEFETETRRRAWWMSIMFDRIVSVGGWLHSVDERDLGTELPLTVANYEAMIEMPSHPQTLHSENVYIRHPINYTDSYILFLKSVMLFGRVTDYSVRMGIRAPLMGHGRSDPTGAAAGSGSGIPNTGATATAGVSSSASPLYHSTSPNVNPHSPSPSASAKTPNSTFAGSGGGNDDPRNAPGFRHLDRLVAVEFLNSFPTHLRSCLGTVVSEGVDTNRLDTDLYMAHLVPHAATITLHSPWVNYAEPATCPSVARCMEAARAIIDKYYLLSSTSFDITLLHPFVTICWYLAAVVQVHLCKQLIEIGDVANEATCWGEINMLRNALVTYGRYSPIGTRQEKMLHPIMQEIINMTTQEQPLLVGLPLYPFSLDTAFQREEKKAAAAAAVAAAVNASLGIGPINPIIANGDENGEGGEIGVGEAVAPIPDVAIADDVEMVDRQVNVSNIVVPNIQRLSGASGGAGSVW